MRMIGFGIIGLLMVGAVGATTFIHFGTQTEVSFVVDHRERVTSRDLNGATSSRFMV